MGHTTSPCKAKPIHTNVRTNAEVRSLVNAMRLKSYYDPEDRPTNPPHPLLDSQEELDPEELDQNLRNIRNHDNESMQRAEIKESHNDGRKSKDNRNQNRGKQVDNKEKPVGNEAKQGEKIKEVTNNRVQNESSSMQNTSGQEKTNSSLQSNKKVKRDKNEAGKSRDNQSSKNKKQNSKETENQEINPVPPEENYQRKPLDNIVKEADPKQKGPQSSNQNEINKTKEQSDVKQKKGKGKKIPSCKDCKSGHCQLFKAEDIKILASQRSNGALYYKVKCHNGTSDWYFPCKIPNEIIREYHVNRTMAGKKRKKPIQKKQLQFFSDTDPNVNALETDAKTEKQISKTNQNTTKLVGIKLIKGRSYYLVQKGNSAPEYQPATMAHGHARHFITFLIETYEKDIEESRISAIKTRNTPSPAPSPLKSVLCDTVHEVRANDDGTWAFLMTYRSEGLPPEWVTLASLPPGTMNLLINFLKRDYYTAIGKPIRY